MNLEEYLGEGEKVYFLNGIAFLKENQDKQAGVSCCFVQLCSTHSWAMSLVSTGKPGWQGWILQLLWLDEKDPALREGL